MALTNPTLTATQVGDLVANTLRDLGRPNFTDISSPLQKHTAMRNLLRKNRVELQSGTGVQFNVMVSPTGAASNVGLGYQDDVNVVDTMVQATFDWRNSQTNYGVIAQTLAMNREPSRIVDLIGEYRIGSMISFAELMEGNFWGPPPAVTDVLTPWGVNTWIVKNATEGFNGGAPSGYTTIGLNPSTYPAWQNWTSPYTNVTEEDFVRKIRKAATFTDFEPAVDGIPSPNTGDEYGFYTNYGVLGPLEELLKAQNDSVGDDLGKFDGKVMFRSIPVKWIPKLEADTTNPFYGINWGWFKTYILRGWWLKETHLPNYPGQHTMSAVFVDSTYNFGCKNRRGHFVASNGTTYPS